MFNVAFYKFSKKQNSTKRPTGGANLSCVIRNDSSIVNPVIELKYSDPTEFNYCYIEEFNRYYFIQNWAWVSGLWIATLNVDILATLKDEIANKSFYILRSSNNYDGNIIDNYYPADTQFTFDRQSIDSFFPNPFWPNRGFFIVGVVSKTPSFGSLDYLAFDFNGMQQLLGYLLDDNFISLSNGFDPQEFSIALQKVFVDPFQYIRSCVWVPISALFGGEYQTNTPIYSWTLNNVASYKLGTSFESQTKSFTNLKRHPQSASRGNYCNLSPYTTVNLYFPPFGMIPLDTTEFSKTSSVDLKFTMDCLNGIGRLVVSMNGNVTNDLTTQVGVPIELSQVTKTGAVGLAKTVAGSTAAMIGLGGGFSGLALAGGAIAAEGVGDAISSMLGGGKLQSNGGNGSFADLVDNTPHLFYQFAHLIDDDISRNGRPYCKINTPANMGGYMLIQKADFESDIVTFGELEQAKQLMEGGFYYE